MAMGQSAQSRNQPGTRLLLMAICTSGAAVALAGYGQERRSQIAFMVLSKALHASVIAESNFPRLYKSNASRNSRSGAPRTRGRGEGRAPAARAGLQCVEEL